jgi:hypothetical protein
MREYTNTITFTKNIRGVYSLDPILGCSSGMAENEKGCFGDCYAARYSRKYGYDFSKNVMRNFKNDKHVESIRKRINAITLPFIRMGTSGEPSEDWEHTIATIERLGIINKEIVIITKHWKQLSDSQLKRLSIFNVCVNTSVSALDGSMLEVGLFEYERIKPFCRSVLRVVSCDFNLDNLEGQKLDRVQENIFKKYDVLDTVLRVSLNNPLVTEGIINTHKTKFLGKACNISKRFKKTYIGGCDNCIEMCGVKMKESI